MKNISLKKQLWLFLTFYITVSHSQITSGDIAFSYIQSDSPKRIGMVLLKEINPNDTLYLTDNAYDSLKFFYSNEGYLKWISPNTPLKKGTVLSFKESSSSTYAVNYGSVDKISSFNPSSSGDQLIAFQINKRDTSFICSLNFGTKNSWLKEGKPSTSSSYRPTDELYDLHFNGHKDNGAFSCPKTSISVEQLKSDILDLNNWQLSDDDLNLPFCEKIDIDFLTSLGQSSEIESSFSFGNIIIQKADLIKDAILYDLNGKEVFRGFLSEIKSQSLPTGFLLLRINDSDMYKIFISE